MKKHTVAIVILGLLLVALFLALLKIHALQTELIVVSQKRFFHEDAQRILEDGMEKRRKWDHIKVGMPRDEVERRINLGHPIPIDFDGVEGPVSTYSIPQKVEGGDRVERITEHIYTIRFRDGKVADISANPQTVVLFVDSDPRH